eukprot:4698928-Ditylum_brightwellii.AAC.1
MARLAQSDWMLTSAAAKPYMLPQRWGGVREGTVGSKVQHAMLEGETDVGEGCGTECGCVAGCSIEAGISDK